MPVDPLEIKEGDCALFECEAYNCVSGFREADITFYIEKSGKYEGLLDQIYTIKTYVNEIIVNPSSLEQFKKDLDGELREDSITNLTTLFALFTAAKKAGDKLEGEVNTRNIEIIEALIEALMRDDDVTIYETIYETISNNNNKTEIAIKSITELWSKQLFSKDVNGLYEAEQCKIGLTKSYHKDAEAVAEADDIKVNAADDADAVADAVATKAAAATKVTAEEDAAEEDAAEEDAAAAAAKEAVAAEEAAVAAAKVPTLKALTAADGFKFTEFKKNFDELLDDLNMPLIPLYKLTRNFNMFMYLIILGSLQDDENKLELELEELLLDPEKINDLIEAEIRTLKPNVTNAGRAGSTDSDGSTASDESGYAGSRTPSASLNGGHSPSAANEALGGGRKKSSRKVSRNKKKSIKKIGGGRKKSSRKSNKNTKKSSNLVNRKKNTLKVARNISKRKNKNKKYQHLKGGGFGFLNIFKGCMRKPSNKNTSITLEDIGRYLPKEGEDREDRLAELREIKAGLKNLEGLTSGPAQGPQLPPRTRRLLVSGNKLIITRFNNERIRDSKNVYRRLFKLFYRGSALKTLYFKVAPYRGIIPELPHFCRTTDNTKGQYIYESTIYDILNEKITGKEETKPITELTDKVLKIYGYGITEAADPTFNIKLDPADRDATPLILPDNIKEQIIKVLTSFGSTYTNVSYQIVECDEDYVPFKKARDHISPFSKIHFGDTRIKTFLKEVAKISHDLHSKTGFAHLDLHGDNYFINKKYIRGEPTTTTPNCKFFDFDLSMIEYPTESEYTQSLAYRDITKATTKGSLIDKTNNGEFSGIGHIFDICRICADNSIVYDMGSAWDVADDVMINDRNDAMKLSNYLKVRSCRGGHYLNTLQINIHKLAKPTKLSQPEKVNLQKRLAKLTIEDFKTYRRFTRCVITALWCYLHESNGKPITSFA
jgi:hypothetical protein